MLNTETTVVSEMVLSVYLFILFLTAQRMSMDYMDYSHKHGLQSQTFAREKKFWKLGSGKI